METKTLINNNHTIIIIQHLLLLITYSGTGTMGSIYHKFLQQSYEVTCISWNTAPIFYQRKEEEFMNSGIFWHCGLNKVKQVYFLQNFPGTLIWQQASSNPKYRKRVSKGFSKCTWPLNLFLVGWTLKYLLNILCKRLK